MIEGRDIVCFCNDWDSDPLSKKHIMTRLARRNRVLWVDSIGNRKPVASSRDLERILKKAKRFARGYRKVADNIHVVPPLAVPFFGSSAVRSINKWLLTRTLRHACSELNFRDPMTWSFLPTTADVVGSFGDRFLVYHCVDEFSEFTGADKHTILEMERRLIEKADLVIASSDRLVEKKRRHNRNTYLVTHGVDIEHFRKACSPSGPIPEEIANLRHPVIGFYGLIADWVDLQLVRYLAIERPNWSFALIGKTDTDLTPLNGLQNVHLIGRKEYSTLPDYCKGFDAAILPFAINELTLNANPLKLREYLAAGLPVVTTSIPEAARLGDAVRIGRNPAEFLAQLDSVVSTSKTGPQLSISNSMEHESWDSKVEEMSLLVEGMASSWRVARAG